MPIQGILRYEAVTVAGTAIGMTTTAANSELPTCAVITVEDAAIRFTIDGTTPTATVGHAAEPRDVITLTQRDDLTKFLAIRRDGVSASIRITQGVQYIP